MRRSSHRSGVPEVTITRPADRRPSTALAASLATLAALLGVLSLAPSAEAATFYVEGGNPSCSNSGAGTQAQPYCTISACVSARGGAGNTILVKPGLYREQVTIATSGTAAAQFVVQATGPGVIIDGSEDYSSSAQWTLLSGNVWLASAVTVAPIQVFADGGRLTPAASSVAPAALVNRSWRYVSGQGLYVNAGGGSPATHNAKVGARSYGFRLDKRQYVTVDGFQLQNHESRSIYLTGPGCYGTIISKNVCSWAGNNCIAAVTCSSVVLRDNVTSDANDHGILLQDTKNALIDRNESMRNIRPSTRAANGIYLNLSTNNLITRNRLHHNQDTGLNFATGAHNNVCVQNLLYLNGDHGTDHVGSQNCWHIGDIAYRNYKDGFSFEGASAGHKVYNCIGIDNGLVPSPAANCATCFSLEYDLWCDQQSSVGFQSDYNVWWNSDASVPPIKFIATKYSSVAEYSAATGHDVHSIQANPMFADSALGADFHLTDGSPAIDAATSSIPNWPSTDYEGRPRNDDPSSANTGAGPVPYAEIGAYEFSPNVPPIARLTVDPISGIGPLPVIANGSTSTDSDGGIASYRFDWGDGAVTGPQASPSANHTYAIGEWNLLMTVTDNRGGVDTSAVPVVVSANLVGNPSFETNTSGWATTAGGAMSRVSGGFDGNFSVEVLAPNNTSTFVLNDSPNWINVVNAVNTRYRYTAWVRSLTHTGKANLQVREFNANVLQATSVSPKITLSSTWQLISVDHLSRMIGSTLDFNVVETPNVANEVFQIDNLTGRIVTLDRAPVVTAPATLSAPEAAPMVLHITALDPDGEAMGLTANLANLPVGSNAVFLADSNNTSGTLTWTPTYRDARAAAYNVTFTASNTLTGTATTAITVTNVDPPPVVTAPDVASGAEGVPITVTVRAFDPDSSAITGFTANFSNLPAGHNAVFTPSNAADTLGTMTWTPTFNDAGGPYRVIFTATNSLSGSDTTFITVGGVDQPPTVTSPPNVVAGEATPMSFTITAVDPDGQPVTGFTADLSGLPSGHNGVFTPAADKASATLTWTPAVNTPPGPYRVIFTATNGLTGVDTTFITVNRAPRVVAAATALVGELQTLTFDITASDADGDAITSLTATLTGLPAGHDAVFTPGAGNTTGRLIWHPTSNDGRTAPYTVSFTATNSLSGSATTSITVDQPPVVSAAASTVIGENEPLTFSVSASDPDGQPITSINADLSSLPSGHNAVFTPGPGNAGGTLTWTPTAADGRIAPYNVIFTAQNALSGSTTTAVVVDQAPEVTAPATSTGAENAVLSMTVNAADPDGQAIISLTADLSALPAGNNAVFTPNAAKTSGVLTWTPTYNDSGRYVVHFTAGNVRSGTGVTTLVVSNVDRAPVFAVQPAVTASETDSLRFDISVSDPDGDAIASLTADRSGLPAGNNSSFTPGPGNTTGRLIWTPTINDGAHPPYLVSFTATNALSSNATTAISVDQHPEVTAPATASGTENTQITFHITASDPDGTPIGSLTGDFSSLPAGNNATFVADAGNTGGTFRWTPTYFDAPGPWVVRFNGANSISGIGATSISVINHDRAPIMDCPAFVMGGERTVISIPVTAIDPDGEAITNLVADYSGLPANADVHFTPAAGNNTGTLTWMPATGDGDFGPYIVTFLASNAMTSANATAIAVDRYPRITVVPTATVGETSMLTLTCTVSDPDGESIDSLYVDLSGLPAGSNAVFTGNATHTAGTLTWTPTFDDGRALTYPIVFKARNALIGSSTTAVTVTGVDRAPIVTAPPTPLIGEGLTLTVPVSVTDPEGDVIDSLRANLSSLPAGNDATFTVAGDQRSGTFTWTPTPAMAPGPYDVVLTAYNAMSGTSTMHITVDRHPVLTVPATVTAAEGTPLSLHVPASDPDGQAITTLSAVLTGLPAVNNAVFTPDAGNVGGTLTWTPTYSDSGGPYHVTFTGANLLSTTVATDIMVNNTDRAALVATPGTAFVAEGSTVTVRIHAADPDRNPITSLLADFSGLPLGHNAGFVADSGESTGTMTWTPTMNDGRLTPYIVTFIARNALDGQGSVAITVDQRPEIAVAGSLTAGEGAPITLNLTITDPDGQPITLLTANLNGLPAGHNAVFTKAPDNSTAKLTWTPTYNDSRGAPYVVTFTASNALTGAATTSIRIVNTDRAPVVSGVTTASGVGNGTITLNVTATDPDGDVVTSLGCDFSSLPVGNGATYTEAANHASGTFTWTPALSVPRGPFAVIFTAGNALNGTLTTDITVDQAPVVAVQPTFTAPEGNLLTVNVSASDLNGDAITSLTANLAGLPAGSSPTFTPGVGNTTGTLTWTPTYDNAGGPYTVSFTASNALTGTSSTAITVQNVDRAPAITVAPAVSIGEGSQLSLTVLASDPDGQAISSLSANVSGLPAGNNAVFSPGPGWSSGTLTWTPTYDNAGGPYDVVFTASNAMSSSSTTHVTVANTDRAPVVTVESSAVTGENQVVTLHISASDPDGQPITAMTVDLASLPAGNNASLAVSTDQSAGLFTWTPTFDDGRARAYNVTFTAFNALAGDATSAIGVTDDNRAPVVTAPATVTVAENAPTVINITAVDPDGEAITSLTADLTGLPAGNTAVFTQNASHTSGTVTWTPGFSHAGGPYAIVFSANNSSKGVGGTSVTVNNTDRAPVVTAPATASGVEATVITVNVTAVDPDGDPIGSLTANTSNLPVGHGATFSTGAGNTSGTLSWTPKLGEGRTPPYNVTFSAINAMTGTGTTAITARLANKSPIAALTLTPTGGGAPLLVTANAAASRDSDGTVATYKFDFGDGGVVGPQSGSSATHTYGAAGNYTAKVVVTDNLGGRDSTTAPVSVTNNLVVNTGFETNTTGWVSNGSATLSRVAGGHSGGFALQIKAGSTPFGCDDSPNVVAATASPGAVYRVSAWVRSVAATGQAYLSIREMIGSTQVLIKESPRVAISPTWQFLTVDLTVTTGTSLDTRVFKVRGVSGELFLVDDITISLVSSPPIARLTATPTSSVAPLTITANASTSTDPNGTIASYLFDFGDGATVGPQATATASHTYAGAGMWNARVIVTDNAGQKDTADVVVSAAPTTGGTNLVTNFGFETNTTGWAAQGSSTLARIAGGHTGGFSLRNTGSSSATALFGSQDNPNVVVTTAGVGRRYRFGAWVRSAAHTGRASILVRELSGSTLRTTKQSLFLPLSTNWQYLTVEHVVTVAGTTLDLQIIDTPKVGSEIFFVDDVSVELLPAGDQAPVVSAPASATVIQDSLLTLTVTASDPDGQAIVSFTPNFSNLPAGNNATFTTNASKTSLTMTWRPNAAAVRAAPYNIVFTASNALSSTATTAVTVNAPPPVVPPSSNLCGNPGFETDLTGWSNYGSATLARVAGGHSGGFALQMTGGAASSYGTDDLPNWVTTVPAVGTQYRFTAWVRSATSTMPVKLRIYEMNGTTQVGATIYSQEIPVSSTWTQLTANFTSTQTGTTLSFRITAAPTTTGQVFLTDDVEILKLTGSALVANLGGETEDGVAPTVARSAPRAFPTDKSGVLRLDSKAAAWSVQIQGIDDSRIGTETAPTIVLKTTDGGSAVASDLGVGRDVDGDGFEEIEARFALDDLRRLFENASDGRTPVQATLEIDGGTDHAQSIPMALDVRRPMFAASFLPNPMRNEGTLMLTLTRPGFVRAALFDAQGRQVRTLLDEPNAKPGAFSVHLDGRDSRGRMPAGVYFYRIEASEGVLRGRFVLLK